MVQNFIISLIISALLLTAIWHIRNKLLHGSSCCGAGSEPVKKVKVKDRNKANYPYEYTLKVEGMVCSGCAQKVENACNVSEGLWARTDLEHKTVHVRAKRIMNREAFAELLKETGYTLMDVREGRTE